MNETQLRELVTRIVREMFAGAEQQQPAPAAGESNKPNALVLFSGALLGFDAALEALGRLKEHVNLDWRQTDSASRILDQARIEELGMTPAAESLVQAHDLLIVPTLTANLAAKVAHGIGDCLASNVMAEFIMLDKPVVVSEVGVCPDAPEKQEWFPAMPAGYQEMLRGNLDALRSFGVHLTRPEFLDSAVGAALDPSQKLAEAPVSPPRRATNIPPGPAANTGVIDCDKRLLTESDVMGIPDGATVRLRPRALVTALARDRARKHRITLVDPSLPQLAPPPVSPTA